MAIFGATFEIDDLYLDDDDDDLYGQLGEELGETDELDDELDDLEDEIDAELAADDVYGSYGAEAGALTTGSFNPAAAPYFVPAAWRDIAGPDQVFNLFDREGLEIVDALNDAIGQSLVDAPEPYTYPGGWPAAFDDKDAETPDQIQFMRSAVWGAMAKGNISLAQGITAQFHVPGDDSPWVGKLREVIKETFQDDDVDSAGVWWIGMESGRPRWGLIPGQETLVEAIAKDMGGDEEDFNGLAIALFFADRMGYPVYQEIIGDLNRASLSGEDVMTVSTTPPQIPRPISRIPEVISLEEEVVVYPEQAVAPPSGFNWPRPTIILAVGYGLMAGPPLIRAFVGR